MWTFIQLAIFTSQKAVDQCDQDGLVGRPDDDPHSSGAWRRSWTHLPLPQDDEKLHEEEHEVAQMVAVPHGQEHERQELRGVPATEEPQSLVHVPAETRQGRLRRTALSNGRPRWWYDVFSQGRTQLRR